MKLTEDEAADFLCIGPKQCGRRQHESDSRRFCEGSACGMGWRWHHLSVEVLECGPDFPPPSALEGWEMYHTHSDGTTLWRREMKRGWCGLAGEPN